jgi:enamine deaminase RidA (YjgF/YER057c/UK114 family)
MAPEKQAERLFSEVRQVLNANRACILQERVFATQSAMKAVLAARQRVYGDLDDGVPPVLLAVPEGPSGQVTGVQVHAVRSPAAVKPVHLNSRAWGRRLDSAGLGYIAISGLVAPEAGGKADQVRAAFEKAEAALRQAGATMFSIARTWCWLGDILSWYDDFNRVRNRFFTERGLLPGTPDSSRLPASTGIGVYPAGGPECAVDVVAVVGEKGRIEYFREAGNQQSPYHYGSAFSRASRATTPAGLTVYVSGTAAIDAEGRTSPIGDARGQIDVTVENVRAALRDLDCSDGEVVQAIAYSKTPEVEKIFREGWRDRGWPCISVIGDICRDDLLFELEAAACPGARKA